MKLQKCIFVLLIVFFTFSGSIEVLAMETGFTTEEMERESQKRFLTHIMDIPLSAMVPLD